VFDSTRKKNGTKPLGFRDARVKKNGVACIELGVPRMRRDVRKNVLSCKGEITGGETSRNGLVA